MRKDDDVLLVGDERSAKKSGMAEFYRTEVRAHESTGNIEGSPRFVVIVEIPEKVATSLTRFLHQMVVCAEAGYVRS